MVSKQKKPERAVSLKNGFKQKNNFKQKSIMVWLILCSHNVLAEGRK